MGLNYRIGKVERKILDSVTCNRCGKDIPKVSDGGWNQLGELFSVYQQPSFECFFELKQWWGYSSSKDGEEHRAALCRACYDQVFAGCNVEIVERP